MPVPPGPAGSGVPARELDGGPLPCAAFPSPVAVILAVGESGGQGLAARNERRSIWLGRPQAGGAGVPAGGSGPQQPFPV